MIEQELAAVEQGPQHVFQTLAAIGGPFDDLRRLVEFRRAW